MRTALGLFTFVLLGYASANVEAPRPLYSGTVKIVQEAGYNGASDGIQFFGVQRIDTTDIDRATCSIDSDLPLAKAFREAKTCRARLTLECVERAELMELVR